MAATILDPVERRPGEYFKPNSWAQQQALLSDAPDCLYSGRYGSSKSRTLTEKADLYARRWPNARIVLARKRRTDLGLTTLRILLEQTVTPGHVAWGWRRSNDGGACLFYPNGSQILALGLDEPGKLRSGEFDLILVDQAEELEEEEWNAASGRLRNKAGGFKQIIGACNPDSPSHFLYRKFTPTRSHRTWSTDPLKLPNGVVVPPGQLVADTIMAGALDNMENLDVPYLTRLSRYRGRYYQRYVQGLWVAFEGQVYDCWEPELHVVPRPEAWAKWGGYPPPDWPRYRGFDFGYVEPFVCQWWAQDPDGRMWLYREWVRTHMTVARHAEQINAMEGRELDVLVRQEEINALVEGRRARRLDIHPYLSVSDHDAEDRATLDMDDIGTIPAIKDESPGLQTCYDLLVPFQRMEGGPLDSRIRIVDDSLVERDPTMENEGKPCGLAEEIPLLRYREPPKSSTIGRVHPDAVFKEHDHSCDVFRYVMHTKKALGGAEIIAL